MNYLLTIMLYILFSFPLFAQVGIGTIDVNPDAILEMDNPNRGFLLPRVDLLSSTDQVTIPSPAEGSVVFNIGTNISQGIAFWNGTQWVVNDATKDFLPNFNTSFSFSSQAGSSSYRQIAHGLGEVPVRVEVEISSNTGVHAGFNFQGIGSAQADDDGSSDYSGVVFAYNATHIRLWAPDRNNDGSNGRILGVGDGWGGEINTQTTLNTATVYIRAWKKWW